MVDHGRQWSTITVAILAQVAIFFANPLVQKRFRSAPSTPRNVWLSRCGALMVSWWTRGWGNYGNGGNGGHGGSATSWGKLWDCGNQACIAKGKNGNTADKQQCYYCDMPRAVTLAKREAIALEKQEKAKAQARQLEETAEEDALRGGGSNSPRRLGRPRRTRTLRNLPQGTASLQQRQGRAPSPKRQCCRRMESHTGSKPCGPLQSCRN